MSLGEAEEAALVQAVRAAARAEILPRFRNLDAGEIDAKTGPDDLVTEADRRAEAALTEAARAILPGAEVVGEEAAETDPALLDRIGAAETCVILDPVDGTQNFARGLATFGVLVAVAERGETVWGMLYDPLSDDWIRAARGEGVWYCRSGRAPKPLAPRAPVALDQAEVCVSLFHHPRPRRDQVAAALGAAKRLSDLRCSCHEYRQMLLGYEAAKIAWRPKPWDHAAGILALEELGGAAFFADGGRYAPGRREGELVAATDRALAEALIARLS